MSALEWILDETMSRSVILKIWCVSPPSIPVCASLMHFRIDVRACWRVIDLALHGGCLCLTLCLTLALFCGVVLPKEVLVNVTCFATKVADMLFLIVQLF